MSDTLLLLSSPSTVGAKTHTPAGSSDYAAPLGPFDVTRIQIASLADLAEALDQALISSFHVRGETLPPGATSIPYRRTKERSNEPATLAPKAHRIIPIDFDGAGTEQMVDLYSSATAARAVLPWPLCEAGCIAQATSSAGVKPGIRVRLWFYADREVSDTELKHLLGGLTGVDTSIWSAYQPIYVAPPRFLNLPDPFPRRLTVLPGPDLVLPLDLAPPVPDGHLPARAALEQAHAQNPGRMSEGNRNKALTSLAGSMRARGMSEEAILAALLVHNAQHGNPPLPEGDIRTIAASVGRYEPGAAPIALSRDDKRAEADSRRHCKRVKEDSALLPEALAALKAHVDSGSLTEAQVCTRLSEALKGRNEIVPDLAGQLRAAQALAEESGPIWQTDLLRGSDGSPRCSPKNLHLILAKHPDFELWHDVRADEPQWRKCPWTTPRGLVEIDSSELREWFDQEMGWTKLPEDPWDAMRHAASKTRWDPWRQGYLDTLVWDGHARLVHAAEHLLGAPGRQPAMCFAWWMISSVARTYAPGAQVDYLIVLEGKQGAGKSSFLRQLVTHPRYYSRIATSGDLNNPRVIGKLQGPVLVELAELSALTKRDVQAAKEFIDNTVDRWQPLYARTMRDSPRQIVFAGTTNDDDYLKDSTGNRRFWPIKVGKINLDLLCAHRDQLWAEAVHYYRAGQRWYPTEEQAIDLELVKVQEERLQAEFGEDLLRSIIARKRVANVQLDGQPAAEDWQLHNGKLVMGTAEWIRLAMGLGVKDAHSIHRTLRKLGWSNKLTRRGAKDAPHRVWFAEGHEP